MKALSDILIVDDTPGNLHLLSQMLTNNGYKVRPAPSGDYALSTVQKKKPDLILLDIMMPKLNGYQTCQKLKENEHTKDIPIIFLSALDDLQDKIKGFSVGGIDYITKPFHEREVIARVETHLQIHTLQQRLQAETERFKTLVEAAFESIIIHSNKIIIDTNPATGKLYNCHVNDLIGANLEKFIPEKYISSITKENTIPFEGKIKSADGVPLYVEFLTKSHYSDHKRINVTTIRNLTEVKLAKKEKEQLLQENSNLKLTTKERFKFGDIIGRSDKMQKVYELISKASSSKFSVMIHGESGTGKELVAKTIHNLSNRNKEPFITVNSGAITESLFEREFFGHRKGAFTDAYKDELGFFGAAHKGTLFLDEIGELPLTMQVKLLRVLENGEHTPVGDTKSQKTDVRIIAATNRDLNQLVEEGKFREDLYYRIHVIEINLPPLRERREDIGLLMEDILTKYNAHEKISNLPQTLLEMVYHYDWPGNVRELKNILQRFLATDSVGEPKKSNSFLNNKLINQNKLPDAIESLEKQMIIHALERTKWHRSKTSEMLGIPRRSLLRKMQKYELNSDIL